MFGIIKNVTSLVVRTVTLPLDVVSDVANGEIAPRTERNVNGIIDNVVDLFDPDEW